MFRYKLLEELEKGPSTIYELNKKFKQSISTISYELSRLECHGLVTSSVEDGARLYRLTDLGSRALRAAEQLSRGEDEQQARRWYGDEAVDAVRRLGIVKRGVELALTQRDVTGCGPYEELRSSIFVPLMIMSDVARFLNVITSTSELTCPSCGLSFNVPPLVPPGPAPIPCPRCFRSLMLHTYEPIRWRLSSEGCGSADPCREGRSGFRIT
jgi:DNA-binding PadR family transcriptional regulator